MHAPERAEKLDERLARTDRLASPEGESSVPRSAVTALDRRVDPRLVVALQRQAGNAAVSRLVAGRHAPPPALVQRQNEAEAAAAAGAREVQAGQAKAPALVLQVGNDRDIAIAESYLRVLRDNQPRLEAGAAMASPYQDSSRIVSEVVRGETHKLRTQIPPEALATNLAVMTDLELYLAQGKRVSLGTAQFKDHYSVLLTAFGRLEGIAKGYAGMSLHEVKDDAGAGAMVENAVGAGGQSADELSATFNEMLKSDPNVREARTRLEANTKNFEEMPARLSTDMSAANSAVALFDTATASLNVATVGANSLTLRQGFAAAKAKLESAKKLSDKVKGILLKGAEAGGKEGFSAGAAALAAGEGLSALGASVATKGGPAAGLAIAKAAADELLIKPLKEAVSSALTDANAAVGVVSAAADAALKEDAEKAKQDAATIESLKTAKSTLGQAAKKMRDDTEAYAKTAIEFEQRRLAARQAFDDLGTAIEAAAKTRGKAGQGKALAEMVSFLKAAEEFIVQANAVSDIGAKEMTSAPPPPGSDEDPSGPAAAAKAMRKWDGKTVWFAEPYPFTKADGTTVTYYSATESRISVSSYNMDMSEEERKGRGSAEGGEMSVTAAVPEAIRNVDLMKAKVLAIRTAISTRVFGSGA